MRRSQVVLAVIDLFLYVSGLARNTKSRIEGCANSNQPAYLQPAKVCTCSLLRDKFLTSLTEFSVLDNQISTRWTEPVLIAFYTTSVAPRLIQPGSHELYNDPGHMSSLIRKSESVRCAAMACAAVSLSGKFSKDPNWNHSMRRRALSYQTLAITGIQAQIKTGLVDGTEDWLLLAAVILSLADVCRISDL